MCFMSRTVALFLESTACCTAKQALSQHSYDSTYEFVLSRHPLDYNTYKTRESDAYKISNSKFKIVFTLVDILLELYHKSYGARREMVAEYLYVVPLGVIKIDTAVSYYFASFAHDLEIDDWLV